MTHEPGQQKGAMTGERCSDGCRHRFASKLGWTLTSPSEQAWREFEQRSYCKRCGAFRLEVIRE